MDESDRAPRLRAALGAAALALVACLAGAAHAAPVKALNDDDATAYSTAFQASAKGDFDTADRAASAVSDKSLVGYLQLQKLMWPGVKTTYDELRSWLSHYADLPGADRVFVLARKRKPRGEPDPPPPAALTVQPVTDLQRPASGRGQAAREAFYSGDVPRAYKLATASGERWIAGLAAYRLRNYADAVSQFQGVAPDPSQNDWLRSGAAYWASRAAIASGQPELAPDFLRMASRSPETFYGMLAERQLGLEAGADPDSYALAQAGFDTAGPQDGAIIKVSYADLSDPQVMRLIKSDPRARRAVALSQIGRSAEAGQELRAGLTAAQTDNDRRMWMTLAIGLNASAVQSPRQRTAGGFNPDDYPTPALEPEGGFTLDKALVYAVVRQESRFNAYAVSSAGAMGLMQLTPRSAARAAGDDKLTSNSLPLFDAPTNLRIGQDYLTLLMDQGARGDVLRGLAAYNGGPGTLLRTQQLMGDDDPLMLMETMPAPETRAYVEKVMAAYWIYRRMFGESNRAIDAVASGASVVAPTADR